MNENNGLIQQRWYALYTKPRFERKVDEQLVESKIESYLPMQKVIRQWSDRKKKIFEPLFSGYVFVHANPKERIKALQMEGVVRIVSFGGKPSAIPDNQIEALKRFLKEGIHVEILNSYYPGDWVEIIQGPFIGIRGRFVERRNERRFIIHIEAIGQAIAVEIDPAMLRKIDKSERSAKSGKNDIFG